MENQLSASARQQFDRFCRQYLQLQLELDYPDEAYLREDAFQQSLYIRLFKEDAIPHMPPLPYQLRTLKELTKRIEQSIQDWEEEGVSDDLMTSLSVLFASPAPSEAVAAQEKCFVTYTLAALPPCAGSDPTVTLHEARNLLSGAGTTGLRTWEAAFYLGNHLCNHPYLIRGKSILELGSGTGYISILCSKHLSASYVLATDGSDDVVSGLSTNFYLNGLQDSSVIEGNELTWGQALMGSEHLRWNAGHPIDLVLGTDLTYNPTAIPSLVSTFGELFELYPNVKILIAATIRNPETFSRFLETCLRYKYSVDELKSESTAKEMQEGPFYSDEFPIQLCMIRRSDGSSSKS